MADASAKDEVIVEVVKDIVLLLEVDPEWTSLSMVFTFEDGLPSFSSISALAGACDGA